MDESSDTQRYEGGLRSNNPLTQDMFPDPMNLQMQVIDWHCADTWELSCERNGGDPDKIRSQYRWKRPDSSQGDSDQPNGGNGDEDSLDRSDSESDSDDSSDSGGSGSGDEDDTSSDGSSEKTDEDDTYNEQFLVTAFGLTEKGDSVTLQIEGFKPYFYIKVPDNWRNSHVEVLIDKVKKRFWKATAKFAQGLFKWRLIQAKPFRGFTGNDLFNYVRLTFLDKESFNQWVSKFRYPLKLWGINGGEPYSYDLYESNINPMLRLLHIQEIAPSGWIQVPFDKVKVLRKGNPLRISRSQFEAKAHYRSVSPIKGKNDVAPMIIASYDIEADSSHGDFPIARKDYQKLAQDLVNEWNRLYAAKDEMVRSAPRQVIERWLLLCFNHHHWSYNINRIIPEDRNYIGWENDLPELIATVIDEIYNIAQRFCQKNVEYEAFTQDRNQAQAQDRASEDIELQMLEDLEDLQVELTDIFEFNLPVVDLNITPNSHYGLLATQVLSEFSKQWTSNNLAVIRDPKGALTYMIRLAFDGIWNAHGISRVYSTKIPDKELISNMVPGVDKILQACQDWLHQKEVKSRRKKPTAKGKKKEKTPQENALQNRTRNYYVERLNRFLKRHLPPVDGDLCIQIGTTFQRYGEKHPYLKHIITLDTCDPIQNKTIVSDEHKDITFPARELLLGLKEIYKAVSGAGAGAGTGAGAGAGDGAGFTSQSDQDALRLLTQLSEKEGGLSEKVLGTLVKEERGMLNNMLLTWNCEHHLAEEAGTTSVIVESYATEAEVLLAWLRLIQRSDPDIITGYNIFGFDFKFMYERARALGIHKEFGELGRIKGVRHKLYRQELSSSGLGENILNYIPMYGRVLIDMFKVVQANHKLTSYKLDNVCKKFLYKSKNDLPPKDIFILQKGSAADRRRIAEYCLIDCVLVNRLLTKLDIITNQIGMSNVCQVPLVYLFLRGQGVKIQSLVAMHCRLEGFLMPVLPRSEDEEGFEGAIVLPPHPAIYFEPVVVSDFNSLYPSCMISENLCHTSVVQKGGKYDNLSGLQYVDIMFDRYRYETVPGRKKKNKVKCGVETCRFVQLPNGEKSLLPRILRNLLAARKNTRKEQKAFEKGGFEWKVKEGLQLAYKITANSLYGQTGARTSKIYNKVIAACTTATGRNLIYFTKKYFETHYDGAVTVYGDTDSVFVKFVCKDLWGRKLYGLDAIYKSIELNIEGSLAVSRYLKPPHNLEFEKAIWPFILQKKKRYHGHYYTVYGSPKFYANSMGIELKRRDNAPIVKKVLGDTIDIIMIEHDILKAMNLARKMACDLLNGEFGLEDFIITKSLKSYYKNPMQMAHNVLAMRIAKRDPGNKPQANDRIPYAYIKMPKVPKGTKILQGNRIETPQFIRDNDLGLDYKFYLEKQIIKPVSRIFALVTDDLASLFFDAIRDYDYRINGVQKILSFEGYEVASLDRTAYANLNNSILQKVEDESSDESNDDESEEE